jgi:hypothetical protein
MNGKLTCISNKLRYVRRPSPPGGLGRLFLGLFLSLFLAAQGLAANYHDPAYLAAVADASVATSAEISNNLTAIVSYNPNLIWEGAPGASRVKMVSLTRTYYDNYVGQQYNLSFGELWVTVAPELRGFFQGQAQAPSLGRVEQLLGLPPESGYSRVVEFWVSPQDLFRPSPDPEITDTVSELGFPTGVYTSVPQSYKDWFHATQENRFHGTAPYPWTMLGYTYDWGSSNHVGLSEFVIRQGAAVGVASVSTVTDYFAATPR